MPRKKRKKDNKSKMKKAIYSPYIIALVGFVVIVLLSIPLGKKISQRNKIDQEIVELKESIDGLEGNNEDLEKMISYLKSDYFVEKEARLNMGLKKKGEDVFVVNKNEEAGRVKGKTMTSEDNPENKKNNSNPELWWNYFFN